MPHRPKYSGAGLREIRAKNGVGRPKYQNLFPFGTALHVYGSQRAAARTLGMNLSTFQRRLAKEAAQ